MSPTAGVTDDSQSRRVSARSVACKTLQQVLRDGNEVHRFYAARALGAIAPGEDTADLLNCLHDPDEDVRMEAVVALGRLGAVEAVPHLIESLTQDPCADVKVLAIEALDTLDARGAIPALRELVGGQDLDVPWSDTAADMLHDRLDLQAKAARVLGRFGDEKAATAILSLLDEEGADSFGAVATRAFAGMGDAGIQSLQNCINHQLPRLRRQAANALAGMQHDDAPAMLKVLLRDVNAEVRRAALTAVARRDPRDPALPGLLVDTDPRVRTEAVRLSGRLQPEALLVRLRDKNTTVRLAAISVCAELTGEWRATAIQQLVAMFDSGIDSGTTQCQAQLVETLGRIAPDTLRECLPRWLDAALADPAVRAAMARNLAGLGGIDSVTLLSGLIVDEAHAVRIEALSALAQIAGSNNDIAAQQAESALLETLGRETEDQPPVPKDSTAQATEDGNISGPPINSAPDNHVHDTPSADAALPETSVQTTGLDATGTDPGSAEPGDAFPSSTLAAIMGRKAVKPSQQPPEKAIEHSAAELAHLEHAFKRRARRRVSVEPQVSPQRDARRIAARVAGNLNSPAVLQALNKALADSDLELRQGAADSMSRMLERGADSSLVSLKSIAAALSIQDRHLTVSLLKVLSLAPAEKARDSLIRLLEDADAAIRAGSIQALQTLGEDIPQLKRWLDDEAQGVRCAAAMALARRDGRAAVPQLVAQCFRHGGVDRLDIAALLRDLEIPAANEALCAVLSDPRRGGEWRVAIEALTVLHAV